MPTLEITTMVGCPLDCTFCPQNGLAAGYASEVRALSLANFKLILAKVPRHVRIDFSGMSEPWANRFATDMLDHALERGFNVAVYTTLQGMRDPLRVSDLLCAHSDQVEAVVVHLPDTRGNMRGFRDGEPYREALAVFRELPAVFGARAQFMTMGEESSVGPVDQVWHPLARAGNLDRARIEGQAVETVINITTPLSCSYTPFYDQNVLLPSGDVVLCCMDYSSRHKLGNLLTDDYYDLFRSETMAALHASNMRHGESDSICRKCSRARLHDVGESKHFWTWSC